MSLSQITLRAAPLLVAATLALSGPAVAQSAADAYYQAYYLEHEAGDTHAALKLYREVASSRSATPELVRDAELATSRLQEDLAASDLAALVRVGDLAPVGRGRARAYAVSRTTPGVPADRAMRPAGRVLPSADIVD